MNTSRSIAPVAYVLFIALCLCFVPHRVSAQAVLVSEYYNASDPLAEWNEIIVVQDNLDMRGWFVTDNNTNQTARQGGVRFKNIDFWKNVRAGTIIGIWHRTYPSNAITDVDTTIADGRVMIARQDAKFFDIVEWTGQPTGFNLARLGDFIQIFTKDTVHVHAVGHRDDVAPGSYWGAMPAPKTNLLQLCEDRASNRVYPGASMADYNGPNLEVRSQACAGNITRTLPNKDCNTGASNYQFWHMLRTPQWISPTLSASVNAATVSLSWNAMTDPNPGDGVQGYLVVRDSGTTPFVPIDGRVYANGERIGSAVVLAQVSSSSLTYADNVDLPCGVIYTYRVFAYRFGLDDEFGANTAPTTSRGRQYNTSHAFTEVLKPTGIGPKLSYTKGATFCEGSSLEISVPRQPGFSAQWTLNGTDIPNETSLTITARTTGRYRLKLRNAQGCLVLSDSVDVTVNPLPVVDVFPKSVVACKDSTAIIQATVNTDLAYSWQRNGITIPGATTAQIVATFDGDYAVTVMNTATGCTALSPIAKVFFRDIQYAISTTSLSFPDLQDCESFKDDASIVLTNTMTVDTLLFTALESQHFTVVSPAFPLTLPPGKSVSLVIRFTPSNSAPANETLRIVAAPCGIIQSIAASGRKPGAGAGVTTNVTSKDFGVNAFCGTNPTVVDSIIIRVTSATTITAIDVRAPFSVSAPDASGFVMNAGDTRIVPVTFNSGGNPFQVGKSDCVIRYKTGSCSDSLKINLRGSFTLPQILADISDLQFPAVDSCSVLSRDTVIRLTNTSAIDVSVDQLSDPSLRILEIPGSGRLQIPAGATVNVTLRFSPNGYLAVNKKRILFSAQPCLDISGFIFSGERRQYELQSTRSTLNFNQVNNCDGFTAASQSASLNFVLSNGATARLTDIRTSSPIITTDLSVGRLFNGGTTSFTVSVLPGRSVPLGPFNGKIYLTFEPCGMQAEIDVNAVFVSAEIRLSSSLKKDTLINFGTGEIGKSVLRQISIRNTSSVPVTLGPIVGSAPPFSYTVNPPPPSVLQPNEEAYVDIICIPADTTTALQIIPITISGPCNDTVLLRLSVKGTSAGVIPTPFHFEIDHYTAEVGSAVTIPVRIVGTALENLPLSYVGTNITLNQTLYSINNVRIGPALSGFTANLSQVADGVRLTAENGFRISGQGVAWYLEGTACLGNAVSTPLSIDTTSTDIRSFVLVATTPTNGSLTITGGCRLPDRLIAIGGTFALKSMTISTSGQGSIVYETIGEQPTTIELYSLLGERMFTILDAVVTAGTHESTFNASSLSQGTYLLVVRNGERQASMPILYTR